MLDLVSVFTTTGIVLWSRTFCALRGDPVNALIHDVLLENRSGSAEFPYGNYRVRWATDNERGIVYVTVCQKIVPAEESTRVLAALKKTFGKEFPKATDARLFAAPVDFDRKFDLILAKAETTPIRRRATRSKYSSETSGSSSKKKKKGKKKKSQGGRPRRRDGDTGDSDDDSAGETLSDDPLGVMGGAGGAGGAGAGSDDGSGSDVESDDDNNAPPAPTVPAVLPAESAGGEGGEGGEGGSGPDDGAADGGAADDTPLTAEQLAANRRRLMASRGGGRGGRRPRRVMSTGPGRRANKKAKTPKKATPGRSDRTRHRQPTEPKKVATKADMAALDCSRPGESVRVAGSTMRPKALTSPPPLCVYHDDVQTDEARRAAALKQYREELELAARKVEEDEGDDDSGEDESKGGWFASTRIGGFFQSLTGNKVLTDADLGPVMETMKSALVSKNVAAPIADELCASVRKSLVGRKMERLTRAATMVKTAMQEALERILTPTHSTDVLAAVRAKKAKGKPYVVVFIGVNGVGKSTSLAKVCSYVKRGGNSVLVAACDTFRAGAVEQLRTHCDRLDVSLFERGYAKDPAMIAKAAIKSAEEKGHDVVLIDTAGRMQNNEPLMRALAKLVSINSPDLVLFVGEALVGNDGVDQLQFFNQALIDHSETDPPRTVDGIVLTKYDTIDDKVGAAVSMAYKTGKPIVFVGTGQHYDALKRLKVSDVVRSLCT